VSKRRSLTITAITFKCFCAAMIACLVVMRASAAEPATRPQPSGKLVDLGGHKLHVNCTGKGSPTVVVENGLGDFSFDWILVRAKVAVLTRVCTYDRAGYAWSDPGPKPRTFAQINLELRDALAKLREKGPFVLVGHSYGGPVIRNFTMTYPQDVAGMVLVDSAHEGLRVGIGGKATMRLGDGARSVSIPTPHEDMKGSDKPARPADATPPPQQSVDAMYGVLPPSEQKMRVWAQSLSEIEDAESSQREWSAEYFAKWLPAPQAGTLGGIPVVVLTRAEGGYGSDLDVPAAQLEKERKEGQAKLTQLSTNSKQIVVHAGHNMELEKPDDVAAAIRQVVEAVRYHARL